MKNIFKYLGALALGSVLFASCEMNDFPTFNDKDAFVAFASGSTTVVENAGTVKIPVTLASLKGMSATVTVEGVDGTAVNGQNYSIQTSSLTFSADAPTQYVVVDIIDNPGVFTGDLKFTVKFANTGDVNAGAENSCVVTINDLDHPLTSILGEWNCAGESYWYGPMTWTVTFKKDASDPYKVWIDNFAGNDGWAGDDTMIYGIVDTDVTTITIPFGQTSEYVYSNGEPLTYYGLSPQFTKLGAGAGNWTAEIAADASTITIGGENGCWVRIEGAGNIAVNLPGFVFTR